MVKEITSVNDLKTLFPKTVDEITSLATKAVEEAQQAIKTIISIPEEQRTFDNTIRAYDSAVIRFSQAANIIGLFVLVSPQDNLRKVAEQQEVFLEKQAIDLFSQNKELYDAFVSYNEHKAAQEKLTSQEKYLVEQILKEGKRRGLGLPVEQRQKIVALEKELAELETEFSKNIYGDNRSIQVSKEELAGLDEDFINSLKRTPEGLYILGVDYPTYHKVLEFCAVSETRKKLYAEFTNRAFPVNIAILEKLIEKRHQLAELLGFKSYAHLAIDNQMVETPEKVEQFLNDLIAKANIKETQEFNQLLENLPGIITLSDSGKIYPWDRSYLTELYKKNTFNIDEDKISHYFPMEHTVQELLKIYQQFLDLEFVEEKIEGLWHPEVQLIKVYENNQLRGYLLLDLYPRPNKYNHACHATIVSALRKPDGSIRPSVSAVIANFPHSTTTQPSLLKRDDVTTFFHEFGHALHALLGATTLGLFAGTKVKTDFVEMPSQMLEEWFSDHGILKQVSHHYLTGEPLDDDTIKTLIDLKNLSIGNWLQNQILYSLVSLNFFKQDAKKDLHIMFKKLFEQLKPHDYFYENNHFYTAFGHLTGYSAKYYSYLWSLVFAKDLFYHIKKFGLLNPEIGTKYKNTILSQGGSKNPNELLKDFLGRAPTSDAFMQDLGL